MQSSNDSARQERRDLVSAISAMTLESNSTNARSFLEALSGDELRYIAGYLGARMIDPSLCDTSSEKTGTVVAEYTAQSPNPPLDSTHKMLLLRDYLRLSGMTAVQAAGA